MKNEYESLRKLLSFMENDLQKNGNGYTIKEKSFDFSREKTLSYFGHNHKDKKLPCGNDLIGLIEKHEIFQSNILEKTISSAISQELITVRHGSRYYHTRGGKQSTDLINISLTEKGILWLKNYQSGLDKFKRYLGKHFWTILAVAIIPFVIAILKYL